MAWTKESGHWTWDEQGARSGDDVVAKKPQPSTGDHWGRWVYDRDLRTLTFDAKSRNRYEVRLDHLQTAVDFVDCLVGLRSKDSLGRTDLGDFLEAVDDVVGLGSYLRSRSPI